MMDPENKPNNTTETENPSDEKLESISGGKSESLDEFFPRPDENYGYQLENNDLSKLTPCFPKINPWRKS